jgi:tetratricopeptide (TPR) repeat protein
VKALCYLFCFVLILAGNLSAQVSGAIFESSHCSGMANLVVRFTPPKKSGLATIVTKTDDQGTFAVYLDKTDYYVSIFYGAQQLYGKVISVDLTKPLNIVLQSADERLPTHECSFQNAQARASQVALALKLTTSAYFNRMAFESKEAEAKYRQALDIYRQLSTSNPGSYQEDIANALRDLSNVYWQMERVDDAERTYQQALEIYRSLATSNPSRYEPDLAQILAMTAYSYARHNRPKESEAAYLEACNIYRSLSTSNPSRYQPDLARTVAELGGLYWRTGRTKDAERTDVETLDLYQALAKSNPAGYQRDLAQSLLNLAILHDLTGNLIDARREGETAVSIYRGLNKSPYRDDNMAASLVVLALASEDQSSACVLTHEAISLVGSIPRLPAELSAKAKDLLASCATQK